MDFWDIASATSARAILRHLSEEQVEDGNDDFVLLEGGHAHTSDSSSSQHTYVVNSSGSGSGIDGYTSSIGSRNNPMLSPAAEAELFSLSINFLLYVAMVLIITMVAKIYFPESLERGRDGSSATLPMTRSIAYRRVSDADVSDDGEKDGDKNLSYSSEEEGEEEILGETKELGLEEEVILSTTNTTPIKKKRSSKRKLNSNSTTQSNVTSNSTSTSTRPDHHFGKHFSFDFSQEETSKVDVLKRLALCIFMLNITFVTWGLLQERMLTRRYPRYTGEYFTYTHALVFTNRFWTMIFSALILLYLRPKRSQTTVIYEYSFPSISNMLSSWCQYEALKFVSFPAVTLFKSFKLAPVMAMGKLLGNKQYPQYDYFVALMIGIGITMFMSSTDDLQVTYGKNIYDQKEPVMTGMMLLFFFLFFDSFTSQWQSRMFQRHRDLSVIELLFATSAFSTLLSLISLIHSHSLIPALEFVYRHSEIHFHFFLFSICSTIGQLFIFYTIKNFGAVVFTLIMTTRVMLSIALSCFLYGHQVSSTGFFGLMLVFASICYRIKRKAQGQQLVKWRGMDDTRSFDLVHEWHEHVDM